MLGVLCFAMQSIAVSSAEHPIRIMLGITALTACAIGLAIVLRLHMQSTRERRARRLQQATVPLHDIACNNLCYAVRRLQEENLPDVAQAVEESLQITRQSMTSMRALADSQSSDELSADEDATVLNLAKIVDECTARLEQIHREGTVIVEPDCESLVVDASRAQIIAGVVREACGNMMKYGCVSSGYSLTCGVESGVLRMVFCNAVSANSSDDAGLRSTGSGLQYYSQMIEECGGCIRQDYVDDMWVLTVEIPVRRSVRGDAPAAASMSSGTSGVLRGVQDMQNMRNMRVERSQFAHTVVGAGIAWLVLAALSAVAQIVLGGQWGLSLAIGVTYLVYPIAGVVVGLFGSAVNRIGVRAWWLVLIDMVGTGLCMCAMSDSLADLLPSVCFGGIIGLIAGVAGVGFGFLWRMVSNRVGTVYVCAAVAWSVLAVVLVFVMLLNSVQSEGIYWVVPLLSSLAMIAAGCTAIILQRKTR